MHVDIGASRAKRDSLMLSLKDRHHSPRWTELKPSTLVGSCQVKIFFVIRPVGVITREFKYLNQNIKRVVV